MRRLIALLLLVLADAIPAVVMSAPIPPALEAALKSFHTEGPAGWSFTQKTVSSKRQLVERFDASKAESTQWTLIEKDGRSPTAEELKDYREQMSQHPRSQTAPNIKDQFDPASFQVVSDEGERASYRFRLRQGDGADRSAAYMQATLVFDKPTGTIERFELANTEPFSPMLLVKVAEAKTVIFYSLPQEGRPSLLQKIVVKLRGRAMVFKSLDEDMTVTYSDFSYPAPSKLNPF